MFRYLACQHGIGTSKDPRTSNSGNALLKPRKRFLSYGYDDQTDQEARDDDGNECDDDYDVYDDDHH